MVRIMKRKMTGTIRVASIAVSLLMFAAAAQAQFYSILGWGNMKCSEFNYDSPDLNTNLMMAWMLGYVTAQIVCGVMLRKT